MIQTFSNHRKLRSWTGLIFIVKAGNKILATKGFTFVELLIVSVIMLSLLALSAPFASTLRREISVKQTVQRIRTDFVTAMGYALSGKSIASFGAENPDNPPIPSHTALFFKQSSDFGNLSPYWYLELAPEDPAFAGDNATLSPLYSFAKELPTETVSIASILLKSSEGDPGTPASSLLILFASPFGKITFVADPPFTPDGPPLKLSLQDPPADANVRFADIVLQYKDEAVTQTTLRIGKDKTIQIL